MTDRLLHAVYIPANARTETGSELQQRLAKTSQAGVGSGIVEAIGLQPGEQLLTGYFAGQLADVQRRELEELFDADGISIVPFATQDSTPDREDGYYVLENANIQNPAPELDSLARFDGRMVRKGTRESHWRVIRTKPQSVNAIDPVDSTPRVGLSAAAKKVRWFNPPQKTVADATPTVTLTGEHGDINIYDASEPSFDDPELLYTLPYRREYRTDCRVWDTYGKPKTLTVPTSSDIPAVGGSRVGGTRVGGSATTTTVDAQWQRVYSTDHEFRGEMLIETDTLRARIAKPNEDLRIERWNTSGNEYREVSLSGSWQLADASLTRIGQARIVCQMTFADTDSDRRQDLRASFVRGLRDIQFVSPSGSTPTDLVDYLSPVIADSDTIAEPTTGLRKREDTTG